MQRSGKSEKEPVMSRWINKEYALSHPIDKKDLPPYLFHGVEFGGTGTENKLNNIQKDGLCPTSISGVKGGLPSDPNGVYFDLKSSEAYNWGGKFPAVLSIKSFKTC